MLKLVLMQEIIIGNKQLNIRDVERVSRQFAKVKITSGSFRKMDQAAVILRKLIKSRVPIYGVSTQFGNDIHRIDENLNQRNDKIYLNSLKQRQLNLIKSLGCGLGEDVSQDIVRATILLRINALTRGASGARPLVVKELSHLLNNSVTLKIQRYGSIGASGDLIPLASIASVLAKRIKLEPKEGLSLVNGTSFMSAIATLTLYDLTRLFSIMLGGLAMTLEALLVVKKAYDPFVHKVKKHNGQIEVNKFFIKFWRKSKLVNENGLQDFYSLRAIPQGFGPFYENLKLAVHWAENEINSVSDNPIISLTPPDIYYGANFMGYYITEACDILKIDIAQASSWLHAIIANLVHPRKSNGLPANLIEKPEKYSGFKPIQILAAALVVQNRKLSLPTQAVMIPTEGDNQDVNSLGVHAAFDLKEAYENLERLTAILLLAGAQALEFRGIKKASWASQKLHKLIRTAAPFLKKDKPLKNNIENIIILIKKENWSWLFQLLK